MENVGRGLANRKLRRASLKGANLIQSHAIQCSSHQLPSRRGVASYIHLDWERRRRRRKKERRNERVPWQFQHKQTLGRCRRPPSSSLPLFLSLFLPPSHLAPFHTSLHVCVPQMQTFGLAKWKQMGLMRETEKEKEKEWKKEWKKERWNSLYLNRIPMKYK